ncbi:MAG: ATP synthase F1 subunit gamma [Cytophagaceae bacterium]|jgi:F-type H+-transporting ATPase subunit gamma|nr:ATP synthase F1 subunit gamma [Cytophagaceae bacterium]
MANLKDIRTRINSVKTTRQVTSAMKMVSAAKLKKAQDDISHIRPYTSRLASIIHDLNSSLDDDISCAYTDEKKEGKILILVVASNRGLCGAFNTNAVKETQTMIQGMLKDEYKNGEVVVGVMGKQAEKMLKSRGIRIEFEFNDLIQAPAFSKTKEVAQLLMSGFTERKYKRIYLVYNEFANAAVQKIQAYQYLPFSIPKLEATSHRSHYMLEPDANSIISALIPEMLQAMLFQALLESQASEHGARMTSMHKATDNASELIRDLQLSYNKARQTAITNEIIEVTGGADALSG